MLFDPVFAGPDELPRMRAPSRRAQGDILLTSVTPKAGSMRGPPGLTVEPALVPTIARAGAARSSAVVGPMMKGVLKPLL